METGGIRHGRSFVQGVRTVTGSGGVSSQSEVLQGRGEGPEERPCVLLGAPTPKTRGGEETGSTSCRGEPGGPESLDTVLDARGEGARPPVGPEAPLTRPLLVGRVLVGWVVARTVSRVGVGPLTVLSRPVPVLLDSHVLEGRVTSQLR